MLKWYFYLGLALIILAQINFILIIRPFAYWYIPIVWWGFILVVDSLVYKIAGKSMIATYPKEFLFLVLLSVPFWTIFEVYNIFTHSWYYVHYFWYVHIVDFMIIMPAFMETFTLFTVLGVGKKLDMKGISNTRKKGNERSHLNVIRLLVVLGLIASVLPILLPKLGYLFEWTGLFLLIDPINYLTGRPSIIRMVSSGKAGIIARLALGGLVTGFFMEFWNYQAYPKWFYAFSANIRLFEMPLQGYVGYVPFMMEVFLFFALFRSFIFKKENAFLK